MLVFISQSLLFAKLGNGSQAAPPVPDDCTSTPFENGLALRCRLSAINSAEERTNFSVVPSEHTLKLLVECRRQDVRSHLEADGFQGLQLLKHLRIEGCNFRHVPARSFWGLDRLESLEIHTPAATSHLAVEVDAFYGVKQLTSLDLSRNGIRQLPLNTMCPLNHLKRLNLSSNHLRSVADVVVTDSCLANVHDLDLSRNHLTGVDRLQGWTSLSNLRLGNNNIHLVSSDAFSMLRISLRRLDVSGNSLLALPSNVFSEVHYLEWISLSNNSISQLPKTLFSDQRRSLKHVDLSNNLVVGFEAEVFQHLSQLTFLDLSHNNIESLAANSLLGLDSLQQLHLGFNQLITLPAAIFDHTPNLTTLVLSNNMLPRLPDNLLTLVPNLSNLHLDGNVLEQLQHQLFRKLADLKVLDLSRNKLHDVSAALQVPTLQSLSISHNYVSSIRSDRLPFLWRLQASDNEFANVTTRSFEAFPALQVLDLSANKISQMEAGCLDANRALQAVRLDGNRLSRMDGVFQDLANLSWLNVSDNRLTVFDLAMVPESLKWLDLHRNSITVLDNYFQKERRGLGHIDASFNQLTVLGPQNLPDSIETLLVNDNSIATLVPYVFFKKLKLRRVDLSLNKLKTISRNSLRLSGDQTARPEFLLGGNPIRCDCHMAWFKNVNDGDGGGGGGGNVQNFPVISDLESIYCQLLHSKDESVVSPLVDARTEDFLCTYDAHCFALCHCCDYDACDCEMTCPDNCTCYHDNSWSKNIAECSGQDLTDLPDRLPMDATEIFLDDNNIRRLKSHNFIGRKNLKTLFLNRSRIVELENHTFNGLVSLLELHLQDNLLAKLKGDEFRGLGSSLRKLFLHNNRIDSINNSTFDRLRSLRVLFLHGNRLVNFQVWKLSLNPSLRQVSLTGNRWSCGCRFVGEFKRWLRKPGRLLVLDAGSVYCGSQPIISGNVGECDDGDDRGLMTSSKQDLMEPAFRDHTPLLIAVSSASILVVVVAATTVAGFCYRGELRVWLYTRYGIRFFHRIDGIADAEKIFDAFFAYSVGDDVFVRQVMAAELESGGGGAHVSYPNRYKLCLFYRDLPHQVSVADLLIQAVDAAKRTVIVLSENFLKSEWSRFEFKSGLHQALQSSSSSSTRKKIIFVVLGEIPSRDIDPELRLHLKSGQILRWGDKSFWQKLCYLLPDVNRGQPAEDTYSFRYETVPRRAYGGDGGGGANVGASEDVSTRTMTIHI